MNKEKNNKKAVRIFLTVIFVILLIGCQSQMPLSPLDEDQTQINSAVDQYGFKILRAKTASFSKEFVNEQMITPVGGQIELGNPAFGLSSLTFYPFSVTKNVIVRFWWESTGFLEGGCEFSPHGTQFLIPVKLELSYKDAELGSVNEDDLKIYYYHEDTGIWEALNSTVDKEAKTVTAYLEHFSRYAIGDTP
jgi:hypothetical protein